MELVKPIPFILDSRCQRSGSKLLSGYAICDNNIYLSSQRLRKDQLPPHDGQYAWHSFSENTNRFRTDITGRESLFYYCDSSFWAVSNSFLLLVLHLASNQKTVQLYKPILNGFRLKKGRGISAQLVSNNTLASSIKLLPQGSELIIKKSSDRFTVSIARYFNFFDYIPRNNASYLRLVSAMRDKLVAHIEIAQSLGLSTRLSVSAGYDSRELLLAALSASNQDSTGIQVFTEKGLAEASIVGDLCSFLKVDCKDRSQYWHSDSSLYRFSITESIWNTMLANSGVFIPYTPSSYIILDQKPYIDLWGFVAYEWDYYLSKESTDRRHPVSLRVSDIKDEVRRSELNSEDKDSLIAEILSVFQDLDADSESPYAMDLYYLATRSRHHYGRGWHRNQQVPGYVLSPLCITEQILCNLYCSQRGFDKRQFHCDLLSVLDPQVLGIPFDSSWKNFEGITALSCHQSSISRVSQPCSSYGEVARGGHSADINSVIAYLSSLSSFPLRCQEDSISNIADAIGSLVRSALSDHEFCSFFSINEIDSFNKSLCSLPQSLSYDLVDDKLLVLNLYSFFAACRAGLNPPRKEVDFSGYDLFAIDAVFEQGLIRVRVTLTDYCLSRYTPDSFEYAFYLMKGAERLCTQWYSKSLICEFHEFDCADLVDLIVIGFVKHKDLSGVLSKKVTVSH